MTFGSSERYNPTGNQHRLIVRPEAFHVTVLYQPSLVFLGRVTEILPPGLAESARDGSTLLDDFVLTVYFPQLEERVENLVHQAVSGAFVVGLGVPVGPYVVDAVVCRRRCVADGSDDREAIAPTAPKGMN